MLELVHFDAYELNGVLTRGGKRYFITFIDDFSRFTYVYLMRNKGEPLTCSNVIKMKWKIKNLGK